jgi:DNA-binding transcriptional regulator/RsmH inhibitor MraZ
LQWVSKRNLPLQKQKPPAHQKQITIRIKGVPQIDYFERKLDDKRRLTIPMELRDEFESGTVITRGFGNYLHLYSIQTWNEQVEPALKGSILDEKVADLNVQFRTGKIAGDIDAKQGRIVIEQHLLDHGGIDKKIVAVRAGAYWRLIAG